MFGQPRVLVTFLVTMCCVVSVCRCRRHFAPGGVVLCPVRCGGGGVVVVTVDVYW